MSILIYASTIFCSAFLLFAVQPALAKAILPWFGGSASVWTTCLLFFQTVLLAGYLYAHTSIRYLSQKAQIYLHLALLLISLFLLPIIPAASWKPSGQEDPIWRILALLTTTVGLPYFLLSTTAPLVQAWVARVQRIMPYRLYALSNLGSMLALLSFPFLIEPFLKIKPQLISWSWGYGVFVLLCSVAALGSRQPRSPLPGADDSSARLSRASKPALRSLFFWLVLSALPSALLLAVTNHLSQNVAAIPFLWILPLCLYLLSFIICFGRPQWYNSSIYYWVLAAALGAMTYGLLRIDAVARLSLLISVFSAGFFVCCLFFNGELVLRKPSPEHLTTFYLMISLGGALGALFVGVIAPYTFRGCFELPVIIASCGLLALLTIYRKNIFTDIFWTLMAVGLLLASASGIYSLASSSKVMLRNFYGGLRVLDSAGKNPEEATRILVHGVINHGTQFLSPRRKNWPTAYFGPDSGAGRAILHAGNTRLCVGIVGLGAGTLAVYGRPGDSFRFYEINPLILQLAQREFSFLRDCQANVSVILGDARLSLEREPSNQFDILVIDAFSGDSIPVHLLTREAFTVYFRHLKSEGILTLHLSNRYLDLPPVVREVSNSLGKQSRLVITKDDVKNGLSWSVWMMVASHAATLQRAGALEDELPVTFRPISPWTDNFSNQFQVLK